MAPVHPWLRRLFVSYNIFVVVAGGLCLSVILVDVQTTRHIVLCIHGTFTMVMGILGAYGAHKMNWVVLTVNLVCSITASLLMLRAGVADAVARPKLENLMEERWRSFLPLDQASDDIKNQADALQISLHCCGLFSHEDWEENIPKSCLCNSGEELEDKCQTVSYRNFLLNLFLQKKSVFRQNCFPLFMVSVSARADITLAVGFTLFVLALLDSVLSAVMICQMFTSNKPNTPPSAPVLFIDPPPAYQQLYNLSE